MSLKFWKAPKEKTWFTFIVDGKRMAVVEESNKVEKEIERLKGLSGVEIKQASPEDLQHVNAATKIPLPIIRKMESLYHKKQPSAKPE